MRCLHTPWVDIFSTSHHPSDASRTFWGHPGFPARRAFRDCTIRQSFRITLGHHRIRLRLSNQYSVTPLPVTRVTIGLAVELGTSKVSDLVRVTFGGLEGVTIPPGATWVSDPVEYAVANGQDITISIYSAQGKEGDTVAAHEVAKTTSYVVLGDHTWSTSLPEAREVTSWYFVAGIEADVAADALVCLGDSITDSGDRSWDWNEYRGWVNLLFERMQKRPQSRRISVLNAGISGDQLWEGGIPRLERDVLKPQVKYLFILMGTNDLAWTPDLDKDQGELAERLFAGLEQIVARADSAGIKVMVSTILPKLSQSDIDAGREIFRERTRTTVNRWIRANLHCMDWASGLASADERIMDAKYRSGDDYTHPNHAGNRRMADLIDLSFFSDDS